MNTLTLTPLRDNLLLVTALANLITAIGLERVARYVESLDIIHDDVTVTFRPDTPRVVVVAAAFPLTRPAAG